MGHCRLLHRIHPQGFQPCKIYPIFLRHINCPWLEYDGYRPVDGLVLSSSFDRPEPHNPQTGPRHDHNRCHRIAYSDYSPMLWSQFSSIRPFLCTIRGVWKIWGFNVLCARGHYLEYLRVQDIQDASFRGAHQRITRQYRQETPSKSHSH